MKDLGHHTYFLGLEIQYTPSDLFLNQHKYATDFVASDGYIDSSTSDSPIEMNAKLRKEDGMLLPNLSLCWTLVWSLVYLTITRPDLSFAIQ